MLVTSLSHLLLLIVLPPLNIPRDRGFSKPYSLLPHPKLSVVVVVGGGGGEEEGRKLAFRPNESMGKKKKKKHQRAREREGERSGTKERDRVGWMESFPFLSLSPRFNALKTFGGLTQMS